MEQYPEGHKPSHVINGIELFCTCGACPEQYEAFKDKVQVGYLRLRHGTFRVDCPDCGDETVFNGCPAGDGQFEPAERMGYLDIATKYINTWLRRQEKETSE